MKGYIYVYTVDTSKTEDYYLTIQTSSLKPVAEVVVDERFATYQSSNFIIKKITSCSDKTKTLKEIYCNTAGSDSLNYFNAKVGKTITHLQEVPIFKTFKGVKKYYRNFNCDFSQNGWIIWYNADGSLCHKIFVNKGKKIKDVTPIRNEIVTRHFKKNKTFIRNFSGKVLTTYPFVIQLHMTYNEGSEMIYYPKPGKLVFHRTSYLIYDSCNMEYRFRYSKTHHTQQWMNIEAFHGIIFDNSNPEKTKCSVYWFHKLISYNLQTWYHTPWNITSRTNRKIKCF
jgi:hypothetical protein